MPIKTRLTTQGAAEWLEAIAKAGGNVDAAADKALVAGGQILVKGMQQRAPKDTGNLAEHIKASEPQADGNFHYIEVGLVDADKVTSRYGNAQEFGWASHEGHKAGHPYVRPTLDCDMTRARAAMVAVLKGEGIA